MEDLERRVALTGVRAAAAAVWVEVRGGCGARVAPPGNAPVASGRARFGADAGPTPVVAASVCLVSVVLSRRRSAPEVALGVATTDPLAPRGVATVNRPVLAGVAITPVCPLSTCPGATLSGEGTSTSLPARACLSGVGTIIDSSPQ